MVMVRHFFASTQMIFHYISPKAYPKTPSLPQLSSAAEALEALITDGYAAAVPGNGDDTALPTDSTPNGLFQVCDAGESM